MSNILLVPSSSKITFDSNTAGSSTQTALSSSAQIVYNGIGSIGIYSYNTSGTDRFTVDGVNGRLFSVSDISAGSIFSVNDVSGLPIFDISSSLTDKITIGTYGTNALVVNDRKVGIGTATPTEALQVVGSASFSGTSVFGQAKIGTSTPYGTWSRFGHSSFDTTTGYGFMQNSDGAINIDAPTGKTVQILNNNTLSVTIGAPNTISTVSSAGTLVVTGSVGISDKAIIGTSAIYTQYNSSSIVSTNPSGVSFGIKGQPGGIDYRFDDNGFGGVNYSTFRLFSGGRLNTIQSNTDIYFHPQSRGEGSHSLLLGTSSVVVPLSTITPLTVTGSINNYYEINAKNNSAGAAASSDIVVTANTGTATTNFVDLGINGSGFTGAWGGALDGYLYASDNNLWVGTNTPGKNLILSAGTNGASASVTISSSSVVVAQPFTNLSGRIKNVQVKSLVPFGTYTLKETDHIIVCNSTTFNGINVPSASLNTNREYVIKNKGFDVIVDATATGKIDGRDNTTLVKYASLTIVSDGTTWNAI